MNVADGPVREDGRGFPSRGCGGCAGDCHLGGGGGVDGVKTPRLPPLVGEWVEHTNMCTSHTTCRFLGHSKFSVGAPLSLDGSHRGSRYAEKSNRQLFPGPPGSH